MIKIAKTELTKQLENAIITATNKPMGVFGCLEVTIGWYGNQRVDYMTMDTKDIFRCYEIKITKSDFHSKHGHNFLGNYNYYVMPKELYEQVKNEIPSHIGVYTGYFYKDTCKVELTKKSKKQEVKDKEVLKNSLLRSLYRDAEKINQSQDVELLNKLRNKIARLDKEYRRIKEKHTKLENAIFCELGYDKYYDFKDKYDL